MAETADVVIVGGGVMGCSVAFELAQRNVNVVLVEKDALGTASTGRSSAIIRQHYSNELTARMALYSLRVFQDFASLVGDDCGFRQTGFLALVRDEDRLGLEANLALQKRVGIEAELVPPAEVRRLLPGVEIGDVLGAAYEPESGYADPHLTTAGYAEATRRLGARILVGTEVQGVRLDRGVVEGVETTAGPIDAPIVVNCAGPWGARVANMTGVALPIDACRVQVATFQRPAEPAGDHPVVLDFVHGTYFRSETGGLTLVGSIDPSEADDVVNPDDYREQIDQSFVEWVGERWMQRLPSMAESRATGGYAGLYAVTPDWHPVIDEVPPESGAFVCSGFSGHGFKLAPAVARMTADLVTGEDPLFDPRAFRASRFSERDLLRGQYEYSITG